MGKVMLLATLVLGRSLGDEALYLLHLGCREFGHEILYRCRDFHEARVVLLGGSIRPFREKFLVCYIDQSGLLQASRRDRRAWRGEKCRGQWGPAGAVRSRS